MTSKVQKYSISLPPESEAQLEWLRVNYLHAVASIPRSQLIQMAISIAYYSKFNPDF